MEYSPATIMATYLIGAGLMTAPSAGSAWPLYVSHLPDGDNVEDNAGAIYDTTPIKDGRSMRDDSVTQHFGLQITIRVLTKDVGWDKCHALISKLDTVHNTDVVKEAVTYRIHNVTRSGGINSLGSEPGTRRRYIFTINLLVSMSKQ